jgi:hypothetical protein
MVGEALPRSVGPPRLLTSGWLGRVQNGRTALTLRPTATRWPGHASGPAGLSWLRGCTTRGARGRVCDRRRTTEGFDIPPYVTASIIGTAAIGAIAIPAALVRANHRERPDHRLAPAIAAVLFGWLALTAIFAYSGGYEPRPGQLPPTLFALLGAVVGITVSIRAVPRLSSILRDPAVRPTLIRLQVWRIEGVVLLLLFTTGDLPAMFALPAGLGDVAIAVTAPVIARNLDHHRLVVLWNIFGIAVLLVAVTLVVTASPGAAHLFDPIPSVAPMTAFPLAVLPTFLVPLSNALHISSLRSPGAGRVA